MTYYVEVSEGKPKAKWVRRPGAYTTPIAAVLAAKQEGKYPYRIKKEA